MSFKRHNISFKRHIMSLQRYDWLEIQTRVPEWKLKQKQKKKKKKKNSQKRNWNNKYIAYKTYHHSFLKYSRAEFKTKQETWKFHENKVFQQLHKIKKTNQVQIMYLCFNNIMTFEMNLRQIYILF